MTIELLFDKVVTMACIFWFVALFQLALLVAIRGAIFDLSQQIRRLERER